MDRDKLDPLLRNMIFGDADEQSGTSDVSRPDDLDPVGALIREQVFGIRAPGSKPTTRSIAEITRALDAVRQGVVGQEPYASRLQKLRFPLERMAQAAVEFSGPNSPTAEFLKAAAEGSDADMRKAIRRMLVEEAPGD